ncbi:hypothetical protein GDO81_007143 [Engystomops pustulosus]|nr:hypothetical protein GDO81_007143 [Engystomops pustulosus]
MHTGTYSYVPLFGSWIKSICSLWKGYSGLGVTFRGVFTTLPGLWRAQTIQAFTSLVTGVVMPGVNHLWFMSTSMAILDVYVSAGYLTYCRVQGSGQAHPLSQHPGPIGIWAPAFLHTPFTSDDTRATRDWNTCGSNF